MINSYPSIYNLGHSAILELLNGPVIVEEKIDGSQFSFRKDEAGEIHCRSKGANINILAPEGMFKNAVETVKALAPQMRTGFTYRGEYLNTPRHNALAYDRIPIKHIIIFDVNTGLETYARPDDRETYAKEIGLESVPVIFVGKINSMEDFRKLIDRQSVLGGQKIEGVVVKPAAFDLFGKDKKLLMGKFVAESFREVHSKAWESEHKTKGPQDILQTLKSRYGTAARWGKAKIHLEERGRLSIVQGHSASAKGSAGRCAQECAEQISKDLFDWAWPQLRRSITHGLPEWYKEELLKRQFSQVD
jgi:hypothetical protein